MTKHTPGPWHIANGVQIRSERHQIAKVWMMRDGEGNANARLIAAAPELLEALKLAKTIIGHPDDEASKHIAATIAKAEGKNQ